MLVSLAENLAAQPVRPAVVEVAAPIPKTVAGITQREYWSAEVYDFAALVQAVAAGDIPLDCLAPNLPVLNDHAQAMKALLAIPGVRAVNTPGLAG